MNDQDYAIVVGISLYPGFGATPTDNANLRAPVRDAIGIFNWLVSPSGGDLPPDNVELICSDEGARMVDVLDAVPKLEEIQRAFQKLVQRAEVSDAARKGFRAGRRLYIYMSGHGFAPEPYTGCLFVANATRLNVPNVYASGWLKWFRDAACFDEFVLWMDCCMDRMVTVDPEAIPLRPQLAAPSHAPAMVAFAAPRPLRALEIEIDGAIHSVFTHTLLKGLKGAAGDRQSGRVTGRSLGDYIYNAMKDWIPAAEMKNPVISKEPQIVEAASDLVLFEPAPASFTAQSYPITIRFPGAPGPARARLWRGNPAQAEDVEIKNGIVEIERPRGLYVVEVPGQSLRKGFEVTGSGPVKLDVGSADQGRPVKPPPPGGKCQLDIAVGGAAEIFVLDTDFRLVGRGRGGLLKEDKAYGIYKIKTRLGRELHEDIIFLDSDDPIRPGRSSQLNEPVLLAKGGLTALDVLARTHVYSGDGAEILLMVRDDRPPAAFPHSRVVYGTRLLNGARRTIADLDVHGLRRDPGQELAGQALTASVACCRIDLAPGVYFLERLLPGGGRQEQSILAVEGFRTEVHEVRSKTALGDRQGIVQQQVIAMFDQRAAATDQQIQHDAGLIEAATVALADGRKILSGELYERLVTGFKDPIAGLLGGHLLLIEAESDPRFDPAAGLAKLDDVVARLRDLVGDQQPDVEALSQRCARQDLRGKSPLKYPPLFTRSWKLAVDATDTDAQFVPTELWERVHAKLTTTPYFAWASDPKSREAHADGLVAQVREATDAALLPAIDPAPWRAPAWLPAGCDTEESPPAGATEPAADNELVTSLSRHWNIPAAALGQLLVRKAKARRRRLGDRSGRP